LDTGRAQSASDPADLDSSPACIKNVHGTKFVHEIPSAVSIL